MAGQASRENGKKGGRPKGYVALHSEKMREKIFKLVEKDLEDIIKPQIKKAKEGDTIAFKEIMNRALGLPRQNIGLDGGEEGEPIEFKDVSKMTSEEIDEYLRQTLSGAPRKRSKQKVQG